MSLSTILSQTVSEYVIIIFTETKANSCFSIITFLELHSLLFNNSFLSKINIS